MKVLSATTVRYGKIGALSMRSSLKNSWPTNTRPVKTVVEQMFASCRCRIIGFFRRKSTRSLDNFPSDQEVQQLGCQVLRRVYIRARENTIMGSRVVTLGKQMDEVRHLITKREIRILRII